MAWRMRKLGRMAGILAFAIGTSLAMAQDQPVTTPPAAPAPSAAAPSASVPSQAPDASAPPTARSAPTVSLNTTGGDVRAAGAVVSISGQADAIYALGANVAITNATVKGDVYVAGAQIQIDATAGGKVRAAGASIQLKGRLTGGIDAAGAVVLIDAVTVGDVRAAGASITLAPTSDIQQRFEAAGATVEVAGHIGGGVEIAAANIVFAARTDASVTLRGGRITISPDAKIGGDLLIMATEPPNNIPDGIVMGAVKRVEPPVWWGAFSPWAAGVLLAVAVAVGTILAGLVLALFGGRLFVTSVNQVRMRPGSSLLIGLLTVIIVPIIAAALMVTIAGITAGLAVLFVLPVLAVFGHAVAAAGVAGGLFVRTSGRIGIARCLGLLIVGAVLVALLSLIPWVGPWLMGIVLLLGIGALARTAGGRMRRADAVAV